MPAKANNKPLRELRTMKGRELRAEKGDDGKRYISGYAATYNTLSSDLGWDMYERLIPGAFKRAISEKQDVRHLINHDPNLIVGRTKSGTTTLTEDGKGLAFRTQLPDCSYANDLFELLSRGDIDECSFAFYALRTVWIEEQDPEDEKNMRTIREVHDLDLVDVACVAYPAYPGTSATAERSLFPDGTPAEIRSHRKQKRNFENIDGDCSCDCAECEDDNCIDCSNADCDDVNCVHSNSARSKELPKLVKHVDGEDLPAEGFLIVGDVKEPRSWKLPVGFSTEEKTAIHLGNALLRFNQMKNVADADRAKAWPKLVELCQARSVNASADSPLRANLTADQIYDFEKDAILASARLKVIQASL